MSSARITPASLTPVVSRGVDGGSGSARSLLLTVLGELVLPAGGTAWTISLIDVLARLGVEEKAARQAIMRTSSDGWLESERVGRRVRWHLTGPAEMLLRDGAKRIFTFSASQPHWDGSWLVVLARVPETDRRARHLVRSRLSWAGLGALSPGVWISSHADRLDEVEAVLAEAGVDDTHCFVATHELGDEQAMVRTAWDLPGLSARYDEFLVDFADGGAETDILSAHIDLVHRWRRFPQIDPALPRILLPDAWPGAQAAALFARLHTSGIKNTRRAWAALDLSD